MVERLQIKEKYVILQKENHTMMATKIQSTELQRILKEGDEEIAKGNLKPMAIEDLWK